MQVGKIQNFSVNKWELFMISTDGVVRKDKR